MKFNFEKIAFYFMIIAVSGSVGYALKPDPPIEQVTINQKNEACVRAMSMMQFISKQTLMSTNRRDVRSLANGSYYLQVRNTDSQEFKTITLIKAN